MNNNLLLISGKATTGKSLSLMYIDKPEGVMYLNCENNKSLPFKTKFHQYTITDPIQVYEAFEHAETDASVHTIIIDSATYMMDMFESLYIVGNPNGQQAWGEYAQFFKKLMSHYVANATKNVIFIAHTLDILNETDKSMETMVKVKGSLMNTGIESYFTNVVSTKKVKLKDLKDMKSPQLTITEDDEINQFKYVFQTMITKSTVGERMRGPIGMWTRKQTFIDNNVQHVIDRLHGYYDA